MRPELAAIAARQDRVFKREQALTTAYTAQEFRAMTAPGGPWVRVRYGVYTDRARWQASDELAKTKLRDRAALLVCDEGAILSHSAAARLLDLPLDGVDDRLTHVTRLGETQTCRVEAGIKHHTGRLTSEEIVTVGQLRFTSEVRTIVDLSREYGYLPGLVAADAALHRGTPKTALTEYAELHDSDAHAPTVRAVASDAESGAQTVHETRSRVLLTSIGLRDLQLQVRFNLPGGGYAVVDMYCASFHHVFEADGRIKYEQPRDRLGREITPAQKVWDEKRREDQLRGLGLGFSRLIPSDTMPGNFDRVRTRIWAEIHAQKGRSRAS